jgi:mono/diheme cytochrome c family protein
MNEIRKGVGAMKSLRGADSKSIALALAVAAMLAGVMVWPRPEAAAQSAPAAQRAADAPAGNAQRGKATYNRVGCYECHGWDGQSGGGQGPKLGPNPFPYPAFTQQLRSPRNAMPPYTAKVLSDADIADIYAFVRSLPEPPKVESIPLLK